MELDITLLLDKNGNPSRLRKKKHASLLARVKETFPHDDTNTSIYMALHNISEASKCQNCGQDLTIKNFKLGFASRWCSDECRDSDPSFRKELKEAINAKVDKKAALEKRKKTNLEKYGVEHQLQRKEMVQRVMSYNNSNREAIIEKVKKTNLERYGVTCSLQASHIREQLSELYESFPQKTVREFIESLGFECKTDRTIIAPLEIDILVPEKKIGFEINGVFWHSSYDRESDKEARIRHLRKTQKMSEAGYRLVHFTDLEILSKEEIVFSMIRSMLDKPLKRIFARKCEVKKIDTKIARSFFDECHIQGHAPCSIFLGLFHEGSICSAMSFVKSRFDKTYDWELVRFASSLDTTVVGGFSKLLSAFRKKHSGSVVSYADYSRSNGDVYRKNGFVYNGLSNPSYRWIDVNKGLLLNRHSTMRRNLSNLLEEFDPTLTESENCWKAGLKRIWDCGQLKFILE